jgi:tRNA (guanine-N7-)-methyltransferase
MRQKHIKYVTEELLASEGVVTEIQMIETKGEKVYLEIGSGKGKFITAFAKDHPNDHWIAMEVNINITYRILEKRNTLGLKNLTIIHGDAENLLSYIKPDSIDGIYLNFSDPWPKKKHHKRRLTSELFLRRYQTIMKKDAFIQFRTDHLELFEASIAYIEPFFQITELNYSLAESAYMTEYEIKKRAIGPIYQLTGKVDKHAQESI